MAGLCEGGNEPSGSLKATPAMCEVRSVIKFLNAQGIPPIEIDRQLCQVYEPNVMSKKMLHCSTRSSVMMVGLPLRSSHSSRNIFLQQRAISPSKIQQTTLEEGVQRGEGCYHVELTSEFRCCFMKHNFAMPDLRITLIIQLDVSPINRLSPLPRSPPVRRQAAFGEYYGMVVD
ncbi:hypothetical protein ANN_23234 [Periplaneta americana]|uniref:Uncharacterized protein n=1 Tax=Periplaneta americana TaxID=6978 RepID=A0ABQ8SKM4_PERAM|nr:hypothetical protein ANN_23234 [Periplaneta americana]